MDERPVLDKGCLTFQPICVADEDKPKLSRDTKEQIVVHNKFWAKTCGNNKPPCTEK